MYRQRIIYFVALKPVSLNIGTFFIPLSCQFNNSNANIIPASWRQRSWH